VESGAGNYAGYRDEDYRHSGALIVSTSEVWETSEIIIKIRPLLLNTTLNIHEAELLKNCKLLISYLFLRENERLGEFFKTYENLTVFALECTPRITRAQKLDTLSSTTNLVGYRAVLEAFTHLPKCSKSQITAAGKIPPSKVFIIGAGVAGLAAIGVARSLGAVVRAFDSRAETREQIESLGGEFVVMDYKEEGGGGGGYGKQMSERYYDEQKKMVMKQAKEVDVIITTALIPFQKAPILVNANIVRAMKPGSVIVDLAAERGGNCELTRYFKNLLPGGGLLFLFICRPGETFVDPESGVTIVGYYDFPSRMAKQTSDLFSTNMYNLIEELLEIPKNKGDFKKNEKSKIRF